MKKIIILSILVLLAVLATACDSSDLPVEIPETTWEWQQLTQTSPASQSMIADSANYRITFSNDGKFSAKADCNVIEGDYEISGDSLTFRADLPSLQGCGAESSYCQFMILLSLVDGFKLEDGNLVLKFRKDAGKMIFVNIGIVENDEQQSDGESSKESTGDEKNKKVTVCHKPNSKNPVTITIARSALQAHLNHGDFEGSCP